MIIYMDVYNCCIRKKTINMYFVILMKYVIHNIYNLYYFVIHLTDSVWVGKSNNLCVKTYERKYNQTIN